MFALYYLIIVFLVALFGRWKWQMYKILKKLKWLPVLPDGYPLLGSSLRFTKNPKGYLKEFDDITKSTDCGTVVLPAFKYVGICTIDANLFEYILSSTDLVVKADVYRFFWRWLGTGLITANGDKWKSRRRFLTPTFHNSVIESYIETMDKHALQLVEDLKDKLDTDSIDLYPFVNMCTLNIVCETIMGLSLDDPTLSLNKSSYLEHLDEVVNLIQARAFSIYKSFDFIYSFTNSYKREIEVVNNLHDFTNKIINKKRKQLSDNKSSPDEDYIDGKKSLRKSVIDFLLEEKIDDQPLSDKEIREHVDTFTFGGHDTTASGIAFALYCLSRHPEIQQKAFEEQKQIFGNDRFRPITSTDLRNMVYLDLIIKESMRLYPPVPFIAREIHKDSVYNGNIIPKGTFILLYIYGIQRSPKYFKDPEKFIPERFENFNLKNQYIYMPFGSGVRGCMGKQFSFMEMKCVLARFLQNYLILPPKPDNDIKLIAQTVIKSSNGINCCLKRRNWI